MLKDIHMNIIENNGVSGSLVLVSGFWQVKLNEQSKPVTKFSTHNGHWQFARMPFGFSNVPAALQIMVNVIFCNMTNNLVAYLDDITLLGPNAMPVYKY